VILSFHPCFDADVQVILGNRGLDSAEHKLIRDAEAVILPQGCPENLYGVCADSSAHVFPNYKIRFKYPGKMGQSLLFKDFGLPHPKTQRWLAVKKFKKSYPEPAMFPHKLPFFIKDDQSHEADGVFLVKDSPSLLEALDYLIQREGSNMPGFVTQAFIPCGGNVLRAVIIGKQIITYWKRSPKSGQVITAISRGAIIDSDWNPVLQIKGKEQGRLLAEKTGINLAAVDFVFPVSIKDPSPLFLEINYYFGRRGLGGSENYYRLLHQAIQEWLAEAGLNPESVSLI
jgi:ribosomal protein S6--L-glutamate ligase